MIIVRQSNLIYILTGNLILLKFNIMEKINELDEKMLLLMKELKSRGILKYKRDFANACGLPEQNLYNIQQGRNHFTINHLVNLCRFYSINANWVVGTEQNIFIKPNSGTQTVHKSA